MKQLILAEKPSVAKDLGRVLGANKKTKNYYEGPNVIVTWALGHLLGLKMPEDINKNWQTWQMETLPMIPKNIGIKPLPKTGQQLKAIKQLAHRKDIKEFVIATDAGREGELVARWILEWVHFDKPVKRLWISSQTNKAIKEGFKQLKPAKEYDALYESALARSKADWLVGLNISRALTVKYEDSLSAGRVQTPTLSFVRQQEKQIDKFRPQTYYVIELEVAGQKAARIQKNPYEIKEQQEAQNLITQMSQHAGAVVSVNEKNKTENAPLPYDLTEIQREANQRYGFSAKKTLSVVQSLYETHKVVTYPRTDSKYLTNDMKKTMKERLQAIANFSPEVKDYIKSGAKVEQKAVFNDAKVSDHSGLIPTEQGANPAKFSNDEQKIYNMIVTRFLTLFAKAHKKLQQKATVKFGDETFVFTQNKMIEAGWKGQEESEKNVNKWQEGQKIQPNFSIKKELTKPPKPLNEASLLAKMEKFSLGTPATRAEIIDKLLRSELMERTPSGLQVSPKGKQLLDLVNPSLVTPDLTKKWEEELEAIAQNKFSSKKFLAQIEKDTKELVNEVKNSQKKYQDFSITQKKCPECGSFLREKNTRNGKIYVCSNSECSYHRRKDPKVSNHRCPQCHKKMEIIEGKNGAYFRCKFDGITEKIPNKKEQKKKMSKQEEKRLLKQYSKPDEPEESPLAIAMKEAMNKD
ncbi:DNA topoisomerase 3 [Tetragenococcus halophilus]|uniref:DNA topoisomerase n=1 Tax=Tetragenococcus halophilus subsp. halophilus TaxID=1513897 RepID=A0A2H6CS21_TETHA|nr:DNA topoisomerase 3 [Tetragenococcus halophilus]AOF49601.1 DNA topoisomerase III [Tetragenococcus halophilus]MCO7026850.1 DNA topoisomerase 3 [Tetragenococcus halophilus]MCO8293706.1 DNA topoisomerase 3 [Tetragenococcus halophilus]GBD67790.1 DNA topoisomerase III [Tetragenococcus halophilus subsp. halophilus]GBD72838.1 DNA topoisomerase III [Tetragenococcus halophilus subsp. halophilus]